MNVQPHYGISIFQRQLTVKQEVLLEALKTQRRMHCALV
jgi:hypothetical protein